LSNVPYTTKEDREQGEDSSIYEVLAELSDKRKLKEKLEAAKKELAQSGHKENIFLF
jgi:hypothetical protein